MPTSTTTGWSKDRRVVSNTLLWTAPWSAEYFPASKDNRWRYISTAAIEWSKTSVVAVAEMLLELEADNGDLLELWRRFMLAASSTADRTDLQSAEQTSRVDYFLIPSLAVVGNGILMPPRSRLKATATGALVYFGIYATIYEASDLSDILPVIG